MRNLRRNGRSLRGSKSKSRPSQCFSPPQYRRDKKFHTGPPTLLSRAGIDELVSSVCITRSLPATLPGKPISFDRPAGGKRGVSLGRFERRDEDKGTLSLLFVTSYTMSYNSSQLSRGNRSWKLEERGQLIYCHISILKLERGEQRSLTWSNGTDQPELYSPIRIAGYRLLLRNFHLESHLDSSPVTDSLSRLSIIPEEWTKLLRNLRKSSILIRKHFIPSCKSYIIVLILTTWKCRNESDTRKVRRAVRINKTGQNCRTLKDVSGYIYLFKIRVNEVT